MLVVLKNMTPTQSKATENTYKDVLWRLSYSTSHPMAIIRYKASDTVLWINTDDLYLSVSRAHTWADWHQYLSNNSYDPPSYGYINTISKIMGNIMGSAAEAEIGSTYINAQDTVPFRTWLIEMGNPQPTTKIQIDNTTAVDFYKGTQKLSKFMDINFYWL